MKNFLVLWGIPFPTRDPMSLSRRNMLDGEPDMPYFSNIR